MVHAFFTWDAEPEPCVHVYDIEVYLVGNAQGYEPGLRGRCHVYVGDELAYIVHGFDRDDPSLPCTNAEAKAFVRRELERWFADEAAMEGSRRTAWDRLLMADDA